LENLEGFLVNFVVEQTGYPPEVVELDADLEADLGIDSIKKAQLFGELREYFPIQPKGNLTLDDFPTLRHVLRFLQETEGGVASPSTALTPGPSPADGRGEAEVRTPSTAASMPLDQIEGFLVNFVVEQTGYPPEVVELDSDLEADLGIDSIKKAQLFGELREYFPIQPRGNLTLDDFPTLRHIVRFLQEAVGGEGGMPADDQALTPGPPPANGRGEEEGGMPSCGEAAGRHGPEETCPPDASRREGTPPMGPLESFLMDYVTERTGYPPETIPWDADLEADLGIDPVAKAQMVAELQREFACGNGEPVAADRFVTLRQVRDYFAGRGGVRVK